jgi:hypothetical protein
MLSALDSASSRRRARPTAHNVYVSKDVQRRARDRRDAARRREANARERAARSRERGDEFLARLHEDNADQQAAAAGAAERVRRADVEREGERLGEPADDPPGDAAGG